MNFQPLLAAKVMGGQKTVTRRLVSDNPRSPWYSERCGLKVDHAYAVCPGRGKDQIGRVRVVRTTRGPLGHIGEMEARREGFAREDLFVEAWTTINGSYDPSAIVWRVEFAVVPAEDDSLWERAA